HLHPYPVADGDLGEGHAKAARVAIVRRADSATLVRFEHQTLKTRLEREIDRHRAFVPVMLRAVRRRADRDIRIPHEKDDVAGASAGRLDVLGHVDEMPDRSDHRGRPGSKAASRGCASIASAIPSARPLIRMTAASAPGPTTVSVPTI